MISYFFSFYIPASVHFTLFPPVVPGPVGHVSRVSRVGRVVPWIHLRQVV